MTEGRGSSESLEGRRVGRYEVGPLIGEGGMGQVYRGRDPLLRRTVVVKRLHDTDSDEPDRSRRLHREAQYQAQLSHPNIVRVYDFVSEEGVDYIVSEFVAGGSLTAWLETHQGEMVLSLDALLQISRGLAFAHEHGIVHRDLKTENVLVTRDGTFKVTDFGLSQLLEPSSLGQATSWAEDGSVGGTWGSMAPEQLRGEEVDNRVDLFSFGILAYRALAGRSPFEGQTVIETVTHIVERPHEPLRALASQVPVEVSELVDRLLAKSKEARPESFREVIEVLEPLVGAPGVRVHGTTKHAQSRQVAILQMRLDPDDTHTENTTVMEADFQFAARDALLAHSGSLLMGAGNELLACFGYPRSHERNAAVAAQFAAELSTRMVSEGIPATFAVGLDVGQIAVYSRERASIFVGDVIDRARDLATQAGPGRMLTGSTGRPQLIAGGYRAEPVRSALGTVYEVEEKGRPATDLVGRDQVLDALEREAHEVLSGTRGGRTTLIEGEAGIGKSLVVRALLGRLEGRHTLVVHSNPADQYVPYGILKRVCEGMLGIDESEHPDRILAAITDRVSGIDDPMIEAVAADILDVATPEHRVQIEAHSERSGVDRVAQSAARFLLSLAATEPSVVVVEDQHWADRSSRRVLQAMARHAQQIPLFLLLTSRPEHLEDWGTNVGVERTLLERMDRDQARTIIARVPDSDGLAPDVVDSIIERANGVPLWLEELATTMVERGANASNPDLEMAVPASLRDLVQYRLQTLGPSTRHVAEIASAIRGEVPFRLLGEASGRTAKELTADLEALESKGLARRHGFIRKARVSFRHALMETAIYSGAASRHEELHELVYSGLVSGIAGSPEDEPELFAVHAEKAGRVRTAAGHWHAAGRKAASRSAHEAACSHYVRALRQISLLEETPESIAEEKEIRTDYWPSLLFVHGWSHPKLEENAARLETISMAGELPDQWVEMLQHWALAYTAADATRMITWTGLMQERYDSLADGPEKAFLRYILTCARGLLMFHGGQLQESLVAWEQAKQERGDAMPMLSMWPEKSIQVLPGTYSSMCQVILGDGDAALDSIRREESAWDPDSAEFLAAQSIAAVCAAMLGNIEATELRAANVLQNGEGKIIPSHIAVSALLLPYMRILRFLEDATDADVDDVVVQVRAMQGAIETIQASGMLIGVLLMQSHFIEGAAEVSRRLADADVRHGLLTAAERVEQHALRCLESSDVQVMNRYIEPEFHRVRALLRVAQGDEPRSRQCIELAEASRDRLSQISGHPPNHLTRRVERTKRVLAFV